VNLGVNPRDELLEACEVGPKVKPKVSREFRADIKVELEGTWEGEGEPWLSVGDGEGRGGNRPRIRESAKQQSQEEG
jgi:hypothetical protein